MLLCVVLEHPWLLIPSFGVLQNVSALEFAKNKDLKKKKAKVLRKLKEELYPNGRKSIKSLDF